MTQIKSKAYLTQIEKSGIVDIVLQSLNLKKSSTRRKTQKVEKLTDAKKAGSNESEKCVLILTEGDSAKTSALGGISALSNSGSGLNLTLNFRF